MLGVLAGCFSSSTQQEPPPPKPAPIVTKLQLVIISHLECDDPQELAIAINGVHRRAIDAPCPPPLTMNGDGRVELNPSAPWVYPAPFELPAGVYHLAITDHRTGKSAETILTVPTFARGLLAQQLAVFVRDDYIRLGELVPEVIGL